MVDKGDPILIEAAEEIVEEPDANLKKRKLVSQISIQARRRAQRQTHQEERI